jgi:hypothetical protein
MYNILALLDGKAEIAIGRLGRPETHPNLAEEFQGDARPNRVGR